MPIKIPGLQPLAGEDGLIDLGRDGNGLAAARREVHAQDLA
jgi:hypothetical protein